MASPIVLVLVVVLFLDFLHSQVNAIPLALLFAPRSARCNHDEHDWGGLSLSKIAYGRVNNRSCSQVEAATGSTNCVLAQLLLLHRNTDRLRNARRNLQFLYQS